MPRFATALVALLLVIPGPAIGAHHEEPKPKAASDAKKKEKSDQGDESAVSITAGAVTIAGEKVEYVATAGKLPQKSDDGDKKADIFFVAYTRGGAVVDGDELHANADPDRPITFCFNGGPGSASLWLHLGMLGPRRVTLPDDASFPAPPYGVVDNPYSLLDVTDLVFIDPVSTGYSRPAEGEKREQFHGLNEDVRSVAQFVHDYTTKHGRWRSPKFVLGESYGGIRGAALADELQDRYDLYLNGVVFVSAVFDYATLRFEANNDLPYILFLPGYAATAWRHHALDEKLQSKSLDEVVAMAERFAYGPYADALLRAGSLKKRKREAVAKEMARLTGLSVDYVKSARMRVSMWEFSKELLRDQNLLIGRLDSRYTGRDKDRSGSSMPYDPSSTAISGIFGGAMRAYLREELEYEDDRVYEVSGSVRPWSYRPYVNSYVTTAERLREAMTTNPSLEVFAACGQYDLATPPFAMKHSRDHALVRDDLRERFTMRFYEAGHMMYIYEPALVQLREDLLEWYADAIGQ